MIETKITFPNRQGKKLVALLNQPSATGSFPTVIIHHGFKGSKDQTHIAAVAHRLTQAGFQTLRPDLTHTPGESYLPFKYMTTSQEIKDFQDIVDYVFSLPTTDQSRLGLIGFSLGGFIVLHHASQDKRIQAVVSAAGVYNLYERQTHLFDKTSLRQAKKSGFLNVYSHTLGKMLQITYDFYLDSKKYPANSSVSHLTCPVLILHGDKDEAVPLSHSRQYLRLIPNSQLKIIKNADHNFTATPKTLQAMIQAVTRFFTQALKSSS